MIEYNCCRKCESSMKRFKLKYQGSIFWLIFWLIIFFPVAFVLLFTDTTVDIKETHYHLKYEGSRFWLCFWIIICFPIAFLLLIFNGFSITECHCHGK